MEKKKKKDILIKVLAVLAATMVFLVAIVGYLLYASHFYPFDFSREYREIDGWERIVLRSSMKETFTRCSWGVKCTGEDPEYVFSDKIDRESEAYKILSGKTDVAHVSQIVPSPDQRQIAYCEEIWGYYKTGLTDDDYCYYRVYDMETDRIVTLYEGYKAFLWIDWR